MEPSRRSSEHTPELTEISANQYFDVRPLVSDDEPEIRFDAPSVEGDLGQLQHYRIIRRLGEGGMALVFLAEDTHLRRMVALKILSPRLASDDAARRRFLREARAMASVHHEHVTVIYQVGTAEFAGVKRKELPYLAMQYLAGETLQQRLARSGSLPPAEVARIGREVALGLASAHRCGLIHRDIKPSNIWLAEPGARVKILDFGLVRVADSAERLSKTGQVLGTPYFMSPEQAFGEPVDPRSDLFNLGGVLYASLSGKLPFMGATPTAVLKKLATEEPPPLGEIAPWAPPEFASLVHQLMAKSAADRPESAIVVADALAQIETTCRVADSAAGVEPATPSAAKETHRQLHTRDDLAKHSENPLASVADLARAGRRRFLIGAGAALVAGLGWAGYRVVRSRGDRGAPIEAPVEGVLATAGQPIPVGVLYSLTGRDREREVPIAQMIQTALKGINDQGGILGRQVRMIVRDGASDARGFAREAERLMSEDGVTSIFGCRTSASRKAVLAVVEKRQGLLIHSARHEGLEQAERLFCTGALPNQIMVPAVAVSLERNPGASFFFVGNDGLFARAARAILGDVIAAKGGKLVGDAFLSPDKPDVKQAAESIQRAGPKFILNTLDGGGGYSFLSALRSAGVAPQKTPTVYFNLDEQDLRGLPARLVAGDYLAASYFDGAAAAGQRAFIEAYRTQWGDAYAVTDALEATYLGVRLWAGAVAGAGRTDAEAVRLALRGRQLDAPEGPAVRVDPDTLYTSRYFRLGQIKPDGAIHVVISESAPRPPEPFPASRSRKDWDRFLREQLN